MDGLESTIYYLTHGVDYQLLTFWYLIGGFCLIGGYLIVNQLEERKLPTKRFTYEENWPRWFYNLCIILFILWFASLILWLIIGGLHVLSEIDHSMQRNHSTSVNIKLTWPKQ